ncbi:hypothetical protein ACFE04_021225 [Oxalis oulophora]
MEKNTLLCASFKYEELRTVKITLPKRWAITYPQLLQNEIKLSFANGATGPVKLKKDGSRQVVLNGESLQHLIERYNIRQNYRMDFQSMGGNQFLVRIRDKQGVEIEYEKRMIDNSRWYKSKKKATAPSLCKLFGEEEASEGYLALPGIWGKHFEDLTMREVFLLVPDGSRWAIETRSFNDGTIRLFGVEFVKLVRQYGICNNWRAIFGYGENMKFYLRIVDEDGVEIEYAGAHKGERKKNISDDFDFEESGQTDMVIKDTSINVMGKIWYFNGFLFGGKYGDKGEPGFTKKMTTVVYRNMLPIYMPRSFVRKQLLPIGNPTVAFMTIGDCATVECNIRWGSVTSPDDAFISSGLPSVMNLLKPAVGDTILFHLSEWNGLGSFVTFVVETMDE